ncbi:MAG: TetR/AcrR family transcriptional regulator [Actinomycetota bacterium]
MTDGGAHDSETGDRSHRGDDRRRAQLLEAAARVFVQAPPGGLTLAAVATEAGVSKRLMYHYFADVQSLYDDLFEGRIVDHLRNVDTGLANLGTASPAERLALALQVFVALPAAYRRWTLMAVMDMLPPELRSKSGHVLDVLVERWGNQPPFAGIEPVTQRAVLTLTVMDICVLATARDVGSVTTDEAVAVAVTTIIGMCDAARATSAAAG